MTGSTSGSGPRPDPWSPDEASLEEQRLIERLAKIEALFARPGSAGERAAAGNARERIRQRLEEFEKAEPAIEMTFRMPDAWSKELFLALLHRYGIRAYRYSGQRRTTVMARVTNSFSESVLWPEFLELSRTLHAHLHAVTRRVIASAIHGEAAEEEQR